MEDQRENELDQPMPPLKPGEATVFGGGVTILAIAVFSGLAGLDLPILFVPAVSSFAVGYLGNYLWAAYLVRLHRRAQKHRQDAEMR